MMREASSSSARIAAPVMKMMACSSMRWGQSGIMTRVCACRSARKCTRDQTARRARACCKARKRALRRGVRTRGVFMFGFRLPHRCWGRAMLGAAMVLGVTIAAGAAESSVPYVPTPQEVVERMLEMAKVGPHDYLIDLGSGDGRIVVTAAKKRGARGFGVDL